MIGMSYCPYCMHEIADDISICDRCGRNIREYQHPAHILKQGTILNNRYMIGGLIGEGGFGVTYIGLDTLLQYRVAIKEFFPNGMVNRNNTISNEVMSISTETAKAVFSRSRENFLREARMLAKFANEPGIVSVKDFFEENHTVYIVMEYLEGITLKKYLGDVGTISPNNTVCLLMPVFRSLQKIHEKKLIHRDISPDNIMLVGESIKLLDFGAAREFADEKSLSVMLKHGYAPMEQYRRHGIQGAWTDVYAICATMYKCITGKVPPDATDRVFEDELKMPSELGFDVEPAFEAVLRHGLAIRPDERIQDIDELLEELAAVPGMDISENASGLPASPTEKQQTSEPEKPVPEETSDDVEDARLSEYVPRFLEEEEKPQPVPEEKPLPKEEMPVKEQPSEKKQTGAEVPKGTEKPKDAPPKTEKPGGKKWILIGSVAAAVVVAGIAVVLALSSGQSAVETEPSGVASSPSAQSSVKMPEISQKQKTSPAAESQVTSKAESKTESKSASKAESKTESRSASGSESETSEEVVFPDLKSYFKFDNGMLTMDYSLFGKEINEVAKLFSGTLYYSKTHPIYGDQYLVLYIPIKYSESYENSIETIDLLFEDDGDRLIAVEYEEFVPFDDNIAKAARERLGTPDHEEKENILWTIKDKNVTYSLYMREYPEKTRFGSVSFTQKYIVSDAAAE